MSGYRLSVRAAPATASSTDGSGGYGFSLEEILYAVSAAGRPGTYRGIAEMTARSRGPTTSSVLMAGTLGRGARIAPAAAPRGPLFTGGAGRGCRGGGGAALSAPR